MHKTAIGLAFVALLLQILSVSAIQYNRTVECAAADGGCDFNSPYMWVDGIVPTENDIVAISGTSSEQPPLIKITNTTTVMSFFVVNATIVVNGSATLRVTNQVSLLASTLTIDSSRMFVALSFFPLRSKIVLNGASSLSCNSIITDSTFVVCDTSKLILLDAQFNGVVNVFDSASIEAAFPESVISFQGAVFSNSSSPFQFASVSFQVPLSETGQYNILPGLSSVNLTIGDSVEVNVMSLIQINDTLALGKQSVLNVRNLSPSSYSAIQGISSSADSSSVALISIDTSELYLGRQQLGGNGSGSVGSNISSVSLNLTGKTLLHAYNLELGQVNTTGTPDGNPVLDIVAPVTLMANINFNGIITVSQSPYDAHLKIPENVTLVVPTLNSTGKVHVNGTLVATFIYTNGSLLLGGGGVLTFETIIVGGQLNFGGGSATGIAITVETGGYFQVFANTAVVSRVVVDPSAFLSLSTVHTLNLQGDLEVHGGVVFITSSNNDVVDESIFFIQLAGTADIKKDSKFQIIPETAGVLRTVATRYNLINSTNPILGNFTEYSLPGIGTQATLHLAQSSPNQVVFLYTPQPSNLEPGLTTLDKVFIGVGAGVGAALIGFVVYWFVVRKKKQQYQQL